MRNENQYNASGCLDITAYQAITAVDREARQKAAKQRVYICSPFAGGESPLTVPNNADAITNSQPAAQSNTIKQRNIQNALRYCRFAVGRGCMPIAPHCYFPHFMDDNDADERELALTFGIQLLKGCMEMWVFGKTISSGMKREIAAAKARRIPIRYWNEDLEELMHDKRTI